MKLRTVQDVEALKSAVARCDHDVWVESVRGDRYDLKSGLSQYMAIGALLQDQDEELELFAASPCDQVIMMNFLQKLSA